MGASFIDIEFEVSSNTDLTSIAKEFGEEVSVHFCGEREPGSYFLSLQWLGLDSLPDDRAIALCKLVDRLSPSAKKIWDEAEDRCFDLGFNANTDIKVGFHVFYSETLDRLAAIGVRVAVSIYTHDLINRHEK